MKKQDYESIMSEVSKVYWTITDGRISKPNTLADAVISVYEDSVNETVRKSILEFAEENKVHITDGSECWCDTKRMNPVTGEVWFEEAVK